MTNEQVFQAALHLAGELSSSDSTVNADYREHSGYLLAMVCRQCEAVENAYRKANQKGAVALPDQLSYQLSATFPLSAPLSTAAAFGLAALLVADENPDLSASLHARFQSSLQELLASLPMQTESIVDRYAAI